MGRIITAKADVTRIEDHVRRALRTALARGAAIGQAAESRLVPAVEAIDTAVAAKRVAEDAEAKAWAVVLAEDVKSDVAIGNLRDSMWNALGRPRRSAPLEQVFPEGIRTYSGGDPRSQPMMMKVLISRILSSSAPQWTKDMCAGWSADLEVVRQSFESAVEAHRPAEAAATVARGAYRAVVRTGQARLREFKRDLQNMGLDEAQIHEIIPDATAAPSPTPPAPAPPVPPAPTSG
jgi:hypothetical protein